MKIIKDKFTIKTDFRYVENGIRVGFSLKPRFNDKRNFIALIGALPQLTEDLFKAIEKGGRILVDENYVEKETMRKILEEKIEESAQEIEKIKNLVS